MFWILTKTLSMMLMIKHSYNFSVIRDFVLYSKHLKAYTDKVPKIVSFHIPSN